MATSFINSIQTQLLRASSLCQCDATTLLLHASFSNKFAAMRIIYPGKCPSRTVIQFRALDPFLFTCLMCRRNDAFGCCFFLPPLLIILMLASEMTAHWHAHLCLLFDKQCRTAYTTDVSGIVCAAILMCAISQETHLSSCAMHSRDCTFK